MVNFKCDLCSNIMSNQFEFFNHLKSHYEPNVSFKSDQLIKVETELSDSALLEHFFNSDTECETLTNLRNDDLTVTNEVEVPNMCEATIVNEEELEIYSKDDSKIENQMDTSSNEVVIEEKKELVENSKNSQTPLRRSKRKTVKKSIHNIKIELNNNSNNNDVNNDNNGNQITSDNITKMEGSGKEDDKDSDGIVNQENVKENHKDVLDTIGNKNNSKKKRKGGKSKIATVIIDNKLYFKCDLCDRKFTHRSSYDYHKKWHIGQKNFICDTCNKAFLSSTLLKVHKRIHTDERPFNCKMCEKAFRQWSDLKYHFDSLHSNEKNYQCEFCGKGFARSYSLIIHRRIHTGERNYKCDLCEKTFRASCYLLMHRMIHTGEKRYNCDICQKPFRLNSDMKRHRETHSTNRQRREKKVAPKEQTEETIFKVEPCVPDLDEVNDVDFDEASNTFIITPVVIKVGL